MKSSPVSVYCYLPDMEQLLAFSRCLTNNCLLGRKEGGLEGKEEEEQGEREKEKEEGKGECEGRQGRSWRKRRGKGETQSRSVHPSFSASRVTHRLNPLLAISV